MVLYNDFFLIYNDFFLIFDCKIPFFLSVHFIKQNEKDLRTFGHSNILILSDNNYSLQSILLVQVLNLFYSLFFIS